MDFRTYEMPDDRNLRVLESVIRIYTDTAEPVSSAVVARDLRHHWSSATVRNIFSEQEQLRWLFRPHRSSGRVPTELGYRVFVEKVVRPGQCHRDLDSLFDAEVDFRDGNLQEKLDQSLDLLSRLSHVLGIRLFLFSPGEEETPEDCQISGVEELLEQPEFEDPLALKDLIHVIRDSAPIGPYLQGQLGDPGKVRVFIGRENSLALLSPFSLVATRIDQEDRSAYFGVLGPVRMEYSLVMGLLDGLARRISRDGDLSRKWS
ncbi:MAG: hypothetical protein QF492_08465 [Candidatus Krumholzibacteria bacterium]|jgi:transcriptional regulator of heat shock response|nr:hypothetical protein [Candidatus Krumholzibacteria bacterium]MDP7022544.1 hypothetical protein [Candidatus Krumholzibacteria bacterium]